MDNSNKNNPNGNKDEKKPKFSQTIIILAISTILLVIFIGWLNGMVEDSTNKEVSYDKFVSMVKNEEISSVSFDTDKSIITFVPKVPEKLITGQEYK